MPCYENAVAMVYDDCHDLPHSRKLEGCEGVTIEEGGINKSDRYKNENSRGDNMTDR